jgi:chromosome partitioning protein
VADADIQSNACRWAAAAEDENPFPATVVGVGAAGGKLHRELKKVVGDYAYIIVDCPPAADSPVPASALLVSNLVIVPVIPSPLDMWASVAIRKVVENSLDLNEALSARLVINQCVPHTSLSKDAQEVLPQYGIKLFDTYVRQREVYRQSALFGQTVHHFGAKAQAAIDEIEALTDEVLGILGE